MSKKRIKLHLPGDHACEARQVWLAWRDNPDARKYALVQSMISGQPTPCSMSLHSLGRDAA